MIVLEELHFAYPNGPEPVFESLNLSVDTFSWLAMMGPDGSGKTTLGKLIKGLLKPDSGVVHVDVGHYGPTIEAVGPMNSSAGSIHHNASAVHVGYLGGDPYDYLVGTSIEEDVVFGMENLGLGSNEMKVRLEEALRYTGLSGMEHRLTHTLSGGEQQKLAVAATLAMGARVLVLDEALSMLDRPARRAIRALIASLQTEPGITVVEMTLDLEDALTADRLIFLSGGVAAYDGPPADFVATDLGVRWARQSGGMPALRGALKERGLWQAHGHTKEEMAAHLLRQIQSVQAILQK
jgi:energy-coupling factor transport system ATP-binding protein